MNQSIERPNQGLAHSKIPVYRISIFLLVIFLGVFLITFLGWLLKNTTDPEHTISGFDTALSSITGIIATIISLRQLQMAQETTQEQGQENKSLQKQLEGVRDEMMVEIRGLRSDLVERKIVILKHTQHVLDDEQIKQIMPDGSDIDSDRFLARIREYETYLDICEKTAVHLEQNTEQLKSLAKQAGEEAIRKLAAKEPETLKDIGLDLKDNQYSLFTDLFLYLSVWLKNSIRYDQTMPPMKRAVKDRLVYLDALQFLKEQRLKWFLVKDPIGLEILEKYLGLLINQIK